MSASMIALLLQEIPGLISLIESIVGDIQSAKGNVTEAQLANVVTSVGKLTGVAQAALQASMSAAK